MDRTMEPDKSVETKYNGEPFSPGLYEHFKGGQYRAICLATEEKTKKLVVVYMSLGSGRMWTRSVFSWNEYVINEEGALIPRFRKIGLADDLGLVP